MRGSVRAYRVAGDASMMNMGIQAGVLSDPRGRATIRILSAWTNNELQS